MQYDSEIHLAFSKSPTPLSEEQEQLVLSDSKTRHLFWRIVDLLMDPSEDSKLTDLMVTAEWINIRKILWPGTSNEE